MINSEQQEVGFARTIRDFLIKLDGMPTIKINELVENDKGVRGLVSSILPDEVEILLLDEAKIRPGELFKRLDQPLGIPVGNGLLGRSINPLGIPIDGHGLLEKDDLQLETDLDHTASGIASRAFIDRQFDTGVSLIDTLIPIGKGQRELVLGDARSGRSDFLVDIIVNQKNTGVICVYAAIGKSVAEIKTLIETLRNNHALSYTIVVAASSTDPAPLIFLAPQSALTVAEHFRQKGLDVLLILDDMGNHAKIHREISLLGGKSPGRESYPGDIFYQHSHLVERAGNFNQESGGGSITAMPVIELNLNDFTSFIPTNLMSMTDGHILFKSSLYNQGQRPAIDISLSVSRVGQQTQNRVQNALSTRIKQILAQAIQLETVSRFSFELPFETQLILRQRDMIEELIKQPPLTFVPKEIQTILLSFPFVKAFQEQDKTFIQNNREILIKAFSQDLELSKITQAVFNLRSDQELFDILEKISPKIKQMTGVAIK